MSEEELRKALKKRERQFDILAAVSGISEKRLKEIANGAKMSPIEFSTLTMLA